MPDKYEVTLAKGGKPVTVPKDEPLFILRGQDELAWQTVAYYADMLATLVPKESDPPDKYQKAAAEVRGVSERMRRYPTKKLPD